MFKTIIMIVWAFSLHAHNAINKAFHAINKAQRFSLALEFAGIRFPKGCIYCDLMVEMKIPVCHVSWAEVNKKHLESTPKREFYF